MLNICNIIYPCKVADCSYLNYRYCGRKNPEKLEDVRVTKCHVIYPVESYSGRA